MSSKDDLIEIEGTVEESLPNATFRVNLESGQSILAHLSGKMRLNFIKILPGDRVSVDLSVYDLTKGRITRRLPVIKPGSADLEAKTTVVPNSPPTALDDSVETKEASDDAAIKPQDK